MIITVNDVIDNCELAFLTGERKPSAILQCVEYMTNTYELTPEVAELLECISSAASPLIFLNAYKASLACQQEETA